MKEREYTIREENNRPPAERGQTIVLFAIMLVVLLAFVGIAVDVGFGFVRSTQFSSAVDSAALAGVVDLSPTTNDTDDADLRAIQFLAANGWPIGSTTSMTSSRSLTDQGIPQYSLTVTWPVETFFMRILGVEGFPVTRSATAAFFAQAEMFTPTAVDRGQIRKASQFIFGPGACTWGGDPVSPERAAPGTPNAEYHIAEGIYRYRIRVPSTYTQTNIVRVELFNPSSLNLNLANQDIVTYSEAYAAIVGTSSDLLSCTSNGPGDKCVIRTNENLNAINHNPFWFVRVNENWDANCNPVPLDATANVQTSYELYYYDASGNRVNLGRYIDNNTHIINTHLKWVSPGAPAAPGGVFVPANSGSFEVDISPIPTVPGGARFIYMDVKALSGDGKNVWDLWAGLPHGYYTNTLEADVNIRNLQLANNPTLNPTDGVTVYALGRMPLQHYYNTSQVKLHLAPLDATLANGTVYTRLFDYDPTNPPPDIIFTIDTLSIGVFRMEGIIVNDPFAPPPNERTMLATCNNSTDCNNVWSFPQYSMGIPGPEHYFVGGALEASFVPHQNAHTWYMAVTAGRPVLTR